MQGNDAQEWDLKVIWFLSQKGPPISLQCLCQEVILVLPGMGTSTLQGSPRSTVTWLV